MEIINLSNQCSIVNQYLAELRDKDYQLNRLLFRNNIRRIGMMEAYEVSKRLHYERRDVETPLAMAQVHVPTDDVVITTILRAGLPLHEGFLDVFDHADNAFVSAYRTYTDEAHTEVGIHVEYMAAPSLEGRTLIMADPMLATGGSLEMAYKALSTHGTPRHIHLACVMATPEGIATVRRVFPEDSTTLWCAVVDPALNAHKYIVPGFGDAGDLCFGEKM